MSHIVKGKKQYKFDSKVIVGGAYTEVKITETEKEEKDKKNNCSIVKTNTKENKLTDEKLQKFINLKLV